MLFLNELAGEGSDGKVRLRYVTEKNQTWLQMIHTRMIKQSVRCLPRMNPQVLKT